MRKLILILTVVISIVSCEEKNNEEIIPDINDSINIIQVGDNTQTHKIIPPLKLTNENYWINDSTVTDTLKIDLNNDDKSEFIFIYKGECVFINVNSERILSKPINETITLEVNDMIMLEKGIKYSETVQRIKYSQFGDTLDYKTEWIWLADPIVYERQSNISLGGLDTNKNYLTYYKPLDLKYGWISFEIGFNDIYVKELIIEEYGEKQIEKNHPG